VATDDPEGALYVYGVVPRETAPEAFAGIPGVAASGAVALVPGDAVSAVVSPVSLAEFGEDAVAENLRDPVWLERAVRAHDAVLAAAAAATTVVPFRFGAVYESVDRIRELLAERDDFATTIRKLAGTVELGVTVFADRDAMRARAADAGEAVGGRAYLERKLRERELEGSLAELGAETHERLSRAAVAARANPLRRPEAVEAGRDMLLNGAYLVRDRDRFEAELAALRAEHEPRGIVHELSGPWPPYNFAEPDET
jgi:hypothetical protein